MIPCASDSDSGSVDLQLSNLDDVQKGGASVEFTGERGKDGDFKTVNGERDFCPVFPY